MSLTGFEPVTPESEWPQTHALDRAASGIGNDDDDDDDNNNNNNNNIDNNKVATITNVTEHNKGAVEETEL
jgi:hypothetical protein